MLEQTLIEIVRGLHIGSKCAITIIGVHLITISSAVVTFAFLCEDDIYIVLSKDNDAVLLSWIRESVFLSSVTEVVLLSWVKEALLFSWVG